MAINNDKSFNACIKKIKGTSEGLAQSIHEAGVFALKQVNLETHHNTGFAERLIEAMGKKHDAQRVVTWLVHFGKIGVKNGKIVFRARKDITPANVDAILAAAEATPYWELTKQKELKESIDFLKMLQAIPNAMKNAQKKIGEGKNVELHNEAILAEVTKLLAKFQPKQEAVPVAG